jgi:hypothetical protein
MWQTIRTGHRFDVLLEAGPWPLEARLTATEYAAMRPVLDAAAEADRRGEFSRATLGSDALAVIGRDPFRELDGGDTPEHRPGWQLAALAGGLVVIGLGNALSVSESWWYRVGGAAYAVFCAVELCRAICFRIRTWRRR